MVKNIFGKTIMALGLLLALALPMSGLGASVLAADSAAGDAKKTSDSKDTKSTSLGSTQPQDAVQGHASDSVLQIGTIVQIDEKDSSKVTAASYAKAGKMYGVTVDPRSFSLTVTNSDLQNEAFVASSGTYNVLVSSQNGPIKSGDYVTISAINGVGMLAEPEQKTVFGRAAGDFDGKSNIIGTVQLKDVNGKETSKVNISSIPVAIDIRQNPNEKSTKANVPKPLQRLGEAIAEKPVGALRIYLSIAITGISIIAAIVILYSGVRNSLISIGRNPLSKKSVFRALIEIILTSLIILIIGLFAVYLLLKL